MSPSPIRPRLFQPLNIIQHLPSEIVLDLHVCEGGGDVEDLLVAELANFGRFVDVEAGEEAAGGVGADAEEGFEGFLGVEGQLGDADVVVVGGAAAVVVPYLDQPSLWEVDAEDEDLRWVN
jgi:hypothetical protein